jgi:hypothetical protein
MEVMLNDGVCLVPVATWDERGLSVHPELENGSVRLQLCAGGAEACGRPRFAALVQPLMPWSGQFVGADGGTREVQSFRYQTTDGELKALLWCASCGGVRRCLMRDLGPVGIADCPGCGMIPSGRGCARFHNWGCCPECKDGGGRSIADAARDGGTLSSATPDGGPSATKGGALSSLARAVEKTGATA